MNWLLKFQNRSREKTLEKEEEKLDLLVKQQKIDNDIQQIKNAQTAIIEERKGE